MLVDEPDELELEELGVVVVFVGVGVDVEVLDGSGVSALVVVGTGAGVDVDVDVGTGGVVVELLAEVGAALVDELGADEGAKVGRAMSRLAAVVLPAR